MRARAPIGKRIVRGKRFSAFSTCKPGAKHPDPYCIAGARTTSTFIAHDEDRVEYTFCVRKPGGKRNCHGRRTGRAGTPSKIQFSAGRVGSYDLTWKDGPRKFDHDVMLIQPRKVFVNGDSLAEGTKPYLPRALGNWSVSQSVSISRHAPQGVAILRRMGHLPPVVVMSSAPTTTPAHLNLPQRDPPDDEARRPRGLRRLAEHRPPPGGR